MADIGRWRKRSRSIIAEVLRELPVEADLATRKAALRAAYPFGIREHHPYKMWCKEVQLALRPWVKQIRWTLSVSAEGVSCGWCRGDVCALCYTCRREHEDGAGSLLAQFADHAHPEILADALDEAGYPCCAKVLRDETESQVTP